MLESLKRNNSNNNRSNVVVLVVVVFQEKTALLILLAPLQKPLKQNTGIKSQKSAVIASVLIV